MTAVAEAAAPVEQAADPVPDRVRQMYFTESAWHQCAGDCGLLFPATDTWFPDHSRCTVCWRER